MISLLKKLTMPRAKKTEEVFVVELPNGERYEFKTEAEADEFRKAHPEAIA